MKFLLFCMIFVCIGLTNFSCKKLNNSKLASDAPAAPGTVADEQLGDVFLFLAEDEPISKAMVSAPEGSELAFICNYMTILDCKNEISALDPSAVNDRSAKRLGRKDKRQIFLLPNSIDPLETRSVALLSARYEANELIFTGESQVNFEARLDQD